MALGLVLAGCGGAQQRVDARGTVGYTVTPPEGWRDITKKVAERADAPFDVAYGGPVGGGAEANLNVVRRDADGSATLAALVEKGRAEIDGLGNGAAGFTRPTRLAIDGEPALQYDFSANGSRVRQVGTLRRGGYYVVTLTAAGPAFRRAVARLDGLLRSWRWDEQPS